MIKIKRLHRLEEDDYTDQRKMITQMKVLITLICNYKTKGVGMAAIKTENLEKELRSLIAEIIEVEEEKITLDASFVEDLGMDSMMALEILAAIEKKYKLRIPEEHLTKITNLKQVVNTTKEFFGKK